MTVNTRVIQLFMRRQDLPYIPLDDGLRLQILPNITYLPTCQKHHFAAFIADSSLLVVWDDDPKHLLVRARNIEQQLMKMVWKPDSVQYDEKANKSQNVLVTEVASDSEEGTGDGEVQQEKPRKTIMIQSVLCALTLIILLLAIGSGWRQVAIELAIDHSMLRLAFAAVVPLQMWLALVRSMDGGHLSALLTDHSSSSCNH